MSEAPRILLVEDNSDLAYGLVNNLEIEGYDVELVGDGHAAVDRIRRATPDLVILDLTLPGLDGNAVLRTARDEGYTMPVLILSARGEEADKVRGFRLGADDYVTKPFSLLELLARVQVMLRRRTAQAADSVERRTIRFGEIEIDSAASTVKVNGEDVHLTHREFTLLIALYERRGKVASRQNLLRDVWGHKADVLSRTVDTHIVELRKKIERDPASPRYIQTVRRAGYRLELPSS